MAKRAAPDEQPYRPLLDPSLVSAALGPAPVVVPSPTKDISVPRGPEKTPHEVARPAIVKAGRPESQPYVRPVSEREVPQAFVEKFDQEKRILFTRSETQAIDRLVMALARRLNAQVKVSHIIRALMVLVLNAEGEIDKRAGEAPPLVRPANGDLQALQRFERDIARIIASGFRDAPPLRDA
jgi:hypothetical protein